MIASQPLVCQRVPSRVISRSASLLNALPAYPILLRSGVLVWELVCRCVSRVDWQTGRIVQQLMHAIRITWAKGTMLLIWMPTFKYTRTRPCARALYHHQNVHDHSLKNLCGRPSKGWVKSITNGCFESLARTRGKIIFAMTTETLTGNPCQIRQKYNRTALLKVLFTVVFPAPKIATKLLFIECQETAIVFLPHY